MWSISTDLGGENVYLPSEYDGLYSVPQRLRWTLQFKLILYKKGEVWIERKDNHTRTETKVGIRSLKSQNAWAKRSCREQGKSLH